MLCQPPLTTNLWWRLSPFVFWHYLADFLAPHLFLLTKFVAVQRTTLYLLQTICHLHLMPVDGQVTRSMIKVCDVPHSSHGMPYALWWELVSGCCLEVGMWCCHENTLVSNANGCRTLVCVCVREGVWPLKIGFSPSSMALNMSDRPNWSNWMLIGFFVLYICTFQFCTICTLSLPLSSDLV